MSALPNVPTTIAPPTYQCPCCRGVCVEGVDGVCRCLDCGYTFSFEDAGVPPRNHDEDDQLGET